ncbi:MAG TPA: LLM class flavin-dependent oxidoreductase [Candidatus Bathyarchaeia archaeon]|nr:LLM class flavin-dependent oxidoreductase [Candidatus Bathyarchaeia archaeon]
MASVRSDTVERNLKRWCGSTNRAPALAVLIIVEELDNFQIVGDCYRLGHSVIICQSIGGRFSNWKYGFVLPLGDAADDRDLAVVAEDSGWDGFFVWEPVWGYDAWVQLAAAATVTKRIRLGTMLSPVSRMRPWKLAGETVALDRLSNGRLILSVGPGSVDSGFEEFGEETDRRKRAELVDEGLDILTGLWKGQPFSYDGKHYNVKPTNFYPPKPPVQKPRIPIWIVGAWPRMKSMRRVLRYDGLLPMVIAKDGAQQATPSDIRSMKQYVEKNRKLSTPFDVVVEGRTPGNDPQKARATIRPWQEAGATWWIETMWNEMDNRDLKQLVTKRLKQGPPKGVKSRNERIVRHSLTSTKLM